jgi:hypothetical protein
MGGGEASRWAPPRRVRDTSLRDFLSMRAFLLHVGLLLRLGCGAAAEVEDLKTLTWESTVQDSVITAALEPMHFSSLCS